MYADGHAGRPDAHPDADADRDADTGKSAHDHADEPATDQHADADACPGAVPVAAIRAGRRGLHHAGAAGYYAEYADADDLADRHASADQYIDQHADKNADANGYANGYGYAAVRVESRDLWDAISVRADSRLVGPHLDRPWHLYRAEFKRAWFGL